MIGRVRGRADTARGRDSAALDVDGGLIKGVAAGADAGTGSPAASVLIAAALGLNDGDDGAVVAVADGDGGAAHRGIVDVTDIMAGADARSGGAAGGGNFCCTLDEDGGVAIGVAAAADACAAAAAKGGITAAGGRNGHAVAESDAGVAGGVAARTDARAALVAVAAARGLNSAARNINGSLSGRRETGTDACAVAYIPDVDKALGCDIAVFDLDVGVALGAIAAADAGTIITRSIDGAAGDLDVRGVGRIAAAADGCTGVAGGCDVAVSDMDNGLEGVRRTRRRTVEVSFTAAADGCAVAADGLYRAAFYRDGGVALGAFAAANASARVISGISGGLQRAHRRVADGDVSLAGGVMTAADACTVVGKSMFDTLSGSCIVDVDGRLAGGGFARTDGCAAAAIRVHERILGDVDFGLAGRAFATADACTTADAARGLFNGAAGDVDGGVAPGVAAAADAGTTGAALRVFDGAAGDGDIGVACSVRPTADAGTTLIGPRIDFGSAADGDIGFAGSFATAANAGTIGGADGGDVAACYLNVAGTTVAIVAGVPDAADASRAIAACGSQAAGVAAIFISGCDGQFAGVFSAIVVLFVVLEAGMLAVAGEGIVALERDRRVARALDAEGGVIFGLNVDIVQRHVEGVVIAFGLVDDADDIVGDVFGCAPEVFRRAFQDRSRFVPGLFVVIGVGDLEGCTGVRELAFGCREAALRAFRAFRAFGRGLAAGGGSAARRAGGAALRAFALRVRASRAGVLAAGLVLFRGISLVFLAAGSVVRLVLAFFAAGSVVRLVLVFLVAVVRRHVALGGAEVDHVFVFAVAVF